MSIMREYNRLRTAGNPASYALSCAKTLDAFERLESCGLVRLHIMPDICADYDDLAGDTYNREANPDIQESRMVREEKAFRDSIDQDGVWGCVGQFRIDPDGDWQQADSVWGFVGDDWKDSGYDSDIMAQTVETLRETLRDRCHTCRK